jgi:hypothetical protein
MLFQFRIEINFIVAFAIWSSLQQRNLLSPLLLGTFAKLRKETIYFVMSVRPFARPSVRMEKVGCHWTDIYKI